MSWRGFEVGIKQQVTLLLPTLKPHMRLLSFCYNTWQAQCTKYTQSGWTPMNVMCLSEQSHWHVIYQCCLNSLFHQLM